MSRLVKVKWPPKRHDHPPPPARDWAALGVGSGAFVLGRHSPDGWLIRLRSWVEKRQGRLLNSAKELAEPLDRPELLLALARPRPVHPRSGTSNALLPSGPSVTAS